MPLEGAVCSSVLNKISITYQKKKKKHVNQDLGGAGPGNDV